MTDTQPEQISPEYKQWMSPIIAEWEAIYDRFKNDTTRLIDKHGGADYVRVSAYGGDQYNQLGLHLDRKGRLKNKK